MATPRADYPCNATFRKPIDGAARRGIFRRPAPSSSATVPSFSPSGSATSAPPELSRLATAHAVELAAIEAAILLTQRAALALADLHALAMERPDLFDSKKIGSQGLGVFALLARYRDEAKRRREGKGSKTPNNPKGDSR